MKVNYIYLDITDKCNLNCIYCCKKKTTSKKNTEINMNLLKEILDFGRCNGATSITLSGGEPCLHSNFDGILEKVREVGYESLRVMTNGYLFRSKDCFSNLNLIDEICFSIDSADIVKNGNTRIGFQRDQFDWIQAFREDHKDISLTIKSTITKYNSNCIEELICFARKYNFNKITFGYCLPIGLAAEEETFDDIACAPVCMLNVQNEIKKLQSKYKEIEIVEPCVVFGCKLLEDNTDFDLHIDECGNIFPCDGMNDERFIVGNLRDENGISNIRVNIEQIKDLIKCRNKICHKCSIDAFCNGICLLYGEPSNNYDGDKFCAFRRIKTIANKMIQDVELNE